MTYGSPAAHYGSLPPAELVLTTLGAAGGSQRGTTDTAILRFTTETALVGTAISWADNAANGTRITLGERGLYAVNLQGYALGSGGLTSAHTIAISRNTTALAVVVDGSANNAALGFLATHTGNVSNTLNTGVQIGLSAFVRVTAAEAAAGVILRVHGNAAAIGDPSDVNVDMRIRVLRIVDVKG